MALALCCDGCDCSLTEAKAVRVGMLEPMHYCPKCCTAWRAYEKAEAAERVRAVKAFEGWRTKARAKLRQRLTKLPDE